MNKIKNTLEKNYNIKVHDIEKTNGGWAALAFIVFDTNGVKYFLKKYEKSRTSTPKWTKNIEIYNKVVTYLQEEKGLKNYLPTTIKTNNGYFSCEDQEGIYLLFENINGGTIGEKGYSDIQTKSLAKILHTIHCTNIPFNANEITEDFSLDYIVFLEIFLKEKTYCNHAKFSEIVSHYEIYIRKLMNKFYEIKEYIEKNPPKMVLCHNDIHPWNVMANGDNVTLIDWEGVIIAPIETDLRAIMEDGLLYDEYKKVNGDLVINEKTLLFYKICRILEDTWEFIEQIIYDDNSDEEKLLRNFKKEINHIKDLALGL